MLCTRVLMQTTMLQSKTLTTLTHIQKTPRELQLEVFMGSGPVDPRVSQLYQQCWGLRDSSALAEVLQTLTQATTLLTRRRGQEVVAAASGGPLNNTTVDRLKEHVDSKVEEPQTKRLVHLWASVMAEADLLSHLRLPSLWHVSLYSTSPPMRKVGLARFLISQQRRLAAKLGYGGFCLCCSNPYLARALEKGGYQSLPARPINSYKDLEGHPWLGQGDDPHQEIRVLYRLLHVNKDYDTWLM